MEKFTDLSLKQYLQELASEKSVPGGGSVSAYVGSLAMGLTQMVGRISLKRKKKKDLLVEESQKDDQRRTKIEEIVDALEKTKNDAFQIVDLDPKLFKMGSLLIKMRRHQECLCRDTAAEPAGSAHSAAVFLLDDRHL